MIEVRVGAQYKLNGQVFEVISLTDKVISLCSLVHHYHRFIQADDFELMQQRGQLTLHQRTPSEISQFGRLKSLKEQDLKRIEDHRPYLDLVLEKFGGRIPRKAAQTAFQKLAKKLGHTHAPSCTTVRTWMNRYLAANRNPLALARSVMHRRPTTWSSVTEELIDHYIETEYLKPERPTLMQAYKLFKGHIVRENQECTRLGVSLLSTPSYWTFRRRADRLDRYYITQKRFGTTEANRRSRSGGHLYVDQDVTASSYFDSKALDNMVIHEGSRQCGIPILSCHFNPPARYPTGWDISFGAPCAEKMLRATISSIINHGKMASIITDHGSEVLNVWALTVFDTLGIKPDYVPVRDADAKAIVERFFLTVKDQFCRLFPGFTHGSPNERGEYPSTELASVTLEQYKHAFAKDAPINLSCSRGKLQFSRHLQRHWTKSDRKIMYGELFRPVLRVKREPHPYP